MNENIARIIAFLTLRQKDNQLCHVGQQRLRWWRRNGHKFRSVKAALSTWDAEAIEAWFSYAGIDTDPQRSMSLTQSSRYFAVQDQFNNISVYSEMPEPFKSRLRKIEHDMEVWIDRAAKAALLKRSERALLGDAGNKREDW